MDEHYKLYFSQGDLCIQVFRPDVEFYSYELTDEQLLDLKRAVTEELWRRYIKNNLTVAPLTSGLVYEEYLKEINKPPDFDADAASKAFSELQKKIVWDKDRFKE